MRVGRLKTTATTLISSIGSLSLPVRLFTCARSCLSVRGKANFANYVACLMDNCLRARALRYSRNKPARRLDCCLQMFASRVQIDHLARIASGGQQVDTWLCIRKQPALPDCLATAGEPG